MAAVETPPQSPPRTAAPPRPRRGARFWIKFSIFTLLLLPLAAYLIAWSYINLGFMNRSIEEKISQEPLQIRPERERPLDEYYLFRIHLIPAGGEMIVVAKDFDLVILE